MEKTIAHKVFFSHPPAHVWEYLTRPELMELWLMKNDFQPRLGHQFQFRTNPLPKMDFDGIAYCTVMEIVPFERLCYSWKGGPGNGQITLDSVVEWQLVPKDGGTELQLKHSGFKESGNIFMFTAMNDGWLKNMLKIGDLLNNIRNGAGTV